MRYEREAAIQRFRHQSSSNQMPCFLHEQLRISQASFHLEQIADLCEELGVSLDVSTPSSLSTALRKVIKSADDSATANLIKALATRAMREAEYVSTGISS